MKTSTRITIGLTLAGCAAVLITGLRKDAPTSFLARHRLLRKNGQECRRYRQDKILDWFLRPVPGE